MNQLWTNFKNLSEKCYLSVIQPDMDMNVWEDTFRVLMEIVKVGREKNPDYAKKLCYLDEITDYQFKISVWIEDYLNEIDMREQYEKLEKTCKTLLETFVWEETKFDIHTMPPEANQASPVYLNFRLAAALGAQGKNQEAVDFCQTWYDQVSQSKEDNKWDNIWAATALIYAKLGAQDVEGAGKIVNAYISEDTECDVENEILCTAALLYYQVSGNENAEKCMSQKLEKYQKENEELFDIPEDFDIELPFYK